MSFLEIVFLFFFLVLLCSHLVLFQVCLFSRDVLCLVLYLVILFVLVFFLSGEVCFLVLIVPLFFLVLFSRVLFSSSALVVS